jgi:hypothetical protein
MGDSPNNTMIEHVHYEELCGLVAIGEITEAELHDLRCHLADCNDCCDRLADFSQLSGQVIPLLGEHYAPVAVPAGMADRFRESARRAGVPLSDPVLKSFDMSWLRPRMLTAVCATVLVLVAAGFEAKHAMLRRESATISGPIPIASVSSPGTRISSSTKADIQAAPKIDPAHNADVESAQMQELQEEISLLKQSNSDAHAEHGQLTARIAELSAELTKAQESATQQTASVAQLKQQLDMRQGLDAADIVTIAEREDRIKALQTQIAQSDADVARARSLLAASDQARDLIVARNLHIIDVHDSNGSGKHQLPFGRIFYTEGKSLVFYAYDLQNPGNARDATLAFHVWGGKLGEESAKSLGIFRNESTTEGRWVLTCDDPHLLAQVNTVFVTTETRRENGKEPRGKRILSAFLGDLPNHP